MNKITALSLMGFILFSVLAFADDDQNNQPQVPDTASIMKNIPKPPELPPPPGINKNMQKPVKFMSAAAMGMGLPKTVVPTSDGGIVIVQGNRITKLNKDLQVVKSVELKDPSSN